MAQHHLTLVLNRLDRQEGVAGVLLDLPLDLSLSRVTHHQQRDASDRSRKQDKPQRQLGPQPQIRVALKEGIQNPSYRCEMNGLPPTMRASRSRSGKTQLTGVRLSGPLAVYPKGLVSEQWTLGTTEQVLGAKTRLGRSARL